MPQSGIDSVTVPGVADGWDQAARPFTASPLAGPLSTRYLLTPSHPGAPEMDSRATGRARRMDDEGTHEKQARSFLPGDKVPETGQVFRNPDVAQALT